MFFAKNISKNNDQNITKNLSGKHSQKPFYLGKQSATESLKKEKIQKAAEVTDNLIGNKIANKLLRIHRRIIQRLIHKQGKINRKPKQQLYIYIYI